MIRNVTRRLPSGSPRQSTRPIRRFDLGLANAQNPSMGLRSIRKRRPRIEPVPRRNGRKVLTGFALAALVFLAAGNRGGEVVPGPRTTGAKPPRVELLARGQLLYSSLCRRCHGAHGDAADYPGIVPLAGIDARLPPGQITSLSAPFVGRTFEGSDADALVAYLSSLRGAKGFARPGHLFSEILLQRKLAETTHYRILDVRPQSDYAAGHVPNAVHWPLTPDSFGPGEPAAVEVEAALEALRVGDETFIVIYDRLGGLEAASLWWLVRQIGHTRVAVLDGGWEKYVSSGGPTTDQTPQFQTGFRRRDHPPLPAVPSDPKGTEDAAILRLGPFEGADGFNWRNTFDADGVVHAEELMAILRAAGMSGPGTYRVEGSTPELRYLLFLLHLLGLEPSLDPAGSRLSIPDDAQPDWHGRN